MPLLALVGWTTEPHRIQRVVEDKWVTQPAESWLRRAQDHSALGWVGKGLGDNPDSYYVELDDAVQVDGGTDVRLKSDRGLLLLHRSDDGAVQFMECRERDGDILRWRFEDDPLDVPSPGPDDVLGLPDVLTGPRTPPAQEARSPHAAHDHGLRARGGRRAVGPPQRRPARGPRRRGRARRRGARPAAPRGAPSGPGAARRRGLLRHRLLRLRP